jgi:hypothetical protein
MKITRERRMFDVHLTALTSQGLFTRKKYGYCAILGAKYAKIQG